MLSQEKIELEAAQALKREKELEKNAADTALAKAKEQVEEARTQEQRARDEERQARGNVESIRDRAGKAIKDLPKSKTKMLELFPSDTKEAETTAKTVMLQLVNAAMELEDAVKNAADLALNKKGEEAKSGFTVASQKAQAALNAYEESLETNLKKKPMINIKSILALRGVYHIESIKSRAEEIARMGQEAGREVDEMLQKISAAERAKEELTAAEQEMENAGSRAEQAKTAESEAAAKLEAVHTAMAAREERAPKLKAVHAEMAARAETAAKREAVHTELRETAAQREIKQAAAAREEAAREEAQARKAAAQAVMAPSELNEVISIPPPFLEEENRTELNALIKELELYHKKKTEESGIFSFFKHTDKKHAIVWEALTALHNAERETSIKKNTVLKILNTLEEKDKRLRSRAYETFYGSGRLHGIYEEFKGKFGFEEEHLSKKPGKK